MRLYKYTPALLDPATLRDTLVGRDIELDNLKRIIRTAASGRSLSHAILVGPKGIGKSHILRTLYHAVRGEIATKDLKAYSDKFIPVVSAEEEYPGTLTKFLRLTIDYLVAGGRNVPPAPAGLKSSGPPSEQERDLAIDYIKTFKKKTGKVILLLVDNINDIIESFTEEDQSALRELLMTGEGLLLIGAAPTLFDSIVEHDRPLYNFFEIIWLKELSFGEVKQLLQRYAGLEGKEGTAHALKSREAKLRAVHELAGGNPRLVLSLYQIISEGDLTSVEEVFLKLLDELSPYFRERMKDLSAQQREIVDVMARAEGLLTPTEIADRCRMPVNTVNVQIKRLEGQGFVKVAAKRGRKAIYDINERLFSLWRQMRVDAGRRRLGFIVKFLEIWFSEEERLNVLDGTLQSLRERMQGATAEVNPLLDKLWYFKEAIPGFKGESEALAAYTRGEYEVAQYFLKKDLDESPSDYRLWYNLGLTYDAAGRHEDAIDAYKKALEIKSDDHEAWNNLGTTYAQLGRHEDATGAYKKALEIKPDTHEAWYNLGITYDKTGRYDDAVAALQSSLRAGDDVVAPLNVLVPSTIRLIKAGHADAVRAVLRQIEEAGDSETMATLAPITTVLRYIETEDPEILDRLRQEEKKVVEGILKEISGKGKETKTQSSGAAKKTRTRQKA